MKQKETKMYIITNVDSCLNRIYFYEFADKKDAEEFFNSSACKNTKWNHFELITINGNHNKRAQSIKINNYDD